jgi:hypothetical protein
MRLNSFLCGKLPLEQGVRAIGLFDLGLLLLNALLGILSAISPKNPLFLLPLAPSFAWWVILARIFAVDLPRVIAFGLFSKVPGDASSRAPRLLQGVVRVVTQGVHVALVVYTFTRVGVQPLLLAINIALLMGDLYATAVMFAWYRTTPQEAIEIELKRLGQQRLDINVYRLEELDRQHNSFQGRREALPSTKGRAEFDEVIELDHFRPAK